MDSSKHKIFLDVGKYIYRYQFRFLKNIIKTDTTFNSADLKEYIDKFIIYNLISDVEDLDKDAASLVWFEEEQSVAFQFPQDGKITTALSKIGYDFPELNEYEDEDWI
tara:strand:+ start:269 stop:592 length:324 start_codon:yes stop_codon:yes gene_type:complete